MNDKKMDQVVENMKVDLNGFLFSLFIFFCSSTFGDDLFPLIYIAFFKVSGLYNVMESYDWNLIRNWVSRVSLDQFYEI